MTLKEEASEKGGLDVLLRAAPSQAAAAAAAAAERSTLLETNRDDAGKTAYEVALALIKAQGKVPSRLARLDANRRSAELFCGGVDTTYRPKSTEDIMRANREYIRNFDFHAFHRESQAEKNDTKAKDTTIIMGQETSLFTGHSDCARAARFEAAKAAIYRMRSNIALKKITDDKPAPPVEDKKLATWGTDVADDLVLDPKRRLTEEALKKEEEEEDQRKKKGRKE